MLLNGQYQNWVMTLSKIVVGLQLHIIINIFFRLLSINQWDIKVLLPFITQRIKHKGLLWNCKLVNQNINLLLSVRMLDKRLFYRFNLKMVRVLLSVNLSTIKLNSLQFNRCKEISYNKKASMWQKSTLFIFLMIIVE